jgi:signal transduction histidine kinase/CheY-like chemotaxis protein
MALDDKLPPPPSRAVSIAVSAVLVIVWAFVRLVVFDTTMFPLTYLLPLLVCIWSRDRGALWGMASVFAALHLTKLFWVTPHPTLTSSDVWSNAIATMANIGIGAFAIDAVIRMRTRLELTLTDVRAQAEELQAQSEELAQQNEELTEQAEELSRQSTELSQQGEELASQNEELQSQSEEITALNAALEQRERLLETLLEATRSTSSELAALQHIASAAPGLFGEVCAVAAIYEVTAAGLQLRVAATDAAVQDGDDSIAHDTFASLVIEENRTAALADTALRPDLRVPVVDGVAPIRAVLGAPVRVADQPAGVFAIYCTRQHEWTHDQFRLAEWLADQCGRALQALRAQESLREADRQKSDFLATLSHELRNPLAPIRFALKLIEQGHASDGNALRIIERQFQQLVRLVDDLLDATRLSSNKIQLRRTTCDLTAIVRHAIEAATPDIESAGHRLAVRLPNKPLWLDADEDRIAQVVTNLLTNATRYTPPGGQLTVSVARSGDEALLAVTDTGIGLEPQDAARVFDMFTQVGGPGSGGLGIGLAIVRGIAELHGGRAEVLSKGLGYGSEFRVTLPVGTTPIADHATLNEEPELHPNGTRRVLVVDDNTDSAEMMAALLEMHGHTVWVAHDAHGALALANEVSPEVALLDIGLPGLDGYELARRLRQSDATRRARLVAVTGWGQDGDRAKARDAGFDAHLTKPAAPKDILAVLNDHLLAG